MKKFIVNLFFNRFGIVLAALNLCYFAAKGFVTFDFVRNPSGLFFLCLNLPAMIATKITFGLAVNIFPESFHGGQISLKMGLVGVFVALQWLSIAWLSKTLADRIRQSRLK